MTPSRSRSLRALLASLSLLAGSLGAVSCASSGDDPGAAAAAPIESPEAAHDEGDDPSLDARLARRPLVLSSDDGVVRLALSSSPSDEWAASEPRVVRLETTVVTEREVDLQALSGEHRAWLGTRVALVGPGGVACEGTVERLSLLARVEPHSGTLSVWKGELDTEAGEPSPAPSPSLSPEEIAQDAWEEASEGQLLVATVRADGACEGASFALPAELPRPVSAEAVEPDRALRDRALSALKALPAYRAIQTRYLEEMAELGGDEARLPARWDEADEVSSEARVIKHPGGETLVWVKVSSWGGCGGFSGGLGVVFSLDERGVLDLRSDPASSLETMPRGAADVDGDGLLELLLPEGITSQRGGLFVDESALTIPSHECPC